MSETALNKVLEHARAGAEVRVEFFEEKGPMLVELARTMALCLTRGGKILFCGNGGSAADCQHLAAEFVNRFMLDRPPLPAIALTTDTSTLTAIGNDFGFEQVFEKQVLALGNSGDVLVGISTSGTSPNVLAALKAGQKKGLVNVGFSGGNGGEMLPVCDYNVLVPTDSTPIIQEVHIAAGHMLCLLVDYYLFEAVEELDDFSS